MTDTARARPRRRQRRRQRPVLDPAARRPDRPEAVDTLREPGTPVTVTVIDLGADRRRHRPVPRLRASRTTRSRTRSTGSPPPTRSSPAPRLQGRHQRPVQVLRRPDRQRPADRQAGRPRRHRRHRPARDGRRRAAAPAVRVPARRSRRRPRSYAAPGGLGLDGPRQRIARAATELALLVRSGAPRDIADENWAGLPAPVRRQRHPRGAIGRRRRLRHRSDATGRGRLRARQRRELGGQLCARVRLVRRSAWLRLAACGCGRPLLRPNRPGCPRPHGDDP